MKNQECLRFLKYWRNTLADAARVEIQVDKITHQDKATINFSKGLVDPDQALFLIETAEIQLNEGKGRHNKEDEDWEYLEHTQILIAPFYVSPKNCSQRPTKFPRWGYLTYYLKVVDPTAFFI